MDIHTRQKWHALWPHLSVLPEEGLRLLDAGTGTGRWASELAMRRPHWELVGLDHDAQALQQAQAIHRRCQCSNLSFILGDFLDYQPKNPFDVLLTVCSAHYLFEAGQGDRLFDQFQSWLRPGGWLILLDARPYPEIPASRFLPAMNIRRGISDNQLKTSCANHHFKVIQCQPCVGPWGTWAKQFTGFTMYSRLLAWASFPLQLVMDWVDRHLNHDGQSSSCFWVLIAQKD